ncbi:quinolinate synthase NadA [Aliifodinibius sp. S!AR15-10]|uniref:quinolinate synthase NadA n=1 Tax=Aliifodinibius sp. S!AR15-10 TaxID=2950437 RepID=UPI002858027D|nr:quinolinate synthase NadA [Aliifodinibius sp. S!AR15-10]MDR8390710.1 quinolinate synthase NadA [Aliifodinibius sp. S!AR15-10]
MTKQEKMEAIQQLKKEKKALILAHNYQVPDVQDVADFIGSSLGLARRAERTDAEIIVFCGVHFMAESASIISRDKKVLIPDLEAGCSLAETITAEQLRDWKAKHPGAVVVSYVNTSAEVKAESDYCCTSSNAVQVVESIPEDREILFLPDKFLGTYIEMQTGRDLNIWDGVCHVHEKIGELNLAEVQEEHPDAEVLIHPECGCSTSCMMRSSMYFDCSDAHIHSTGGMIEHAKESEADEFVVATETGILYRLGKENPDKKFYAANEDSVCEFMKMITLDKVYEALKYEQFEVRVPDQLAEQARKPIERMLQIS